MNIESFTTQMDENARRIQLLVEGITDEQARWKPTPETWSVLEVVNHLYDEEWEDFRMRLDYILHHPGEQWPPNDPQNNIVNRHYNERDLKESLNNFLQERQKSLNWLRELGEVDWEKSEVAPWGWTMHAGDMFASWVAHDILHLRQLVELHWAITNQALQPYSTKYAGDW
jgi:hypothetical protein